MKKFFFFLSCLLFPIVVWANGETLHVTQNGAGSMNGLTEANAFSRTQFNTASNWASTNTAGKIDPGDTVEFHGTFTISSNTTDIQPPASGSITSQIVLDGSDATLSYTGGYGGLQIWYQDYLTIYGFNIQGNIGDSSLPYTTDTRSGIFIGGSASNHAVGIIVDSNTINQTVQGIMLAGKTDYVTLTRNTITNCNGNGVWSSNYLWGVGYVGLPTSTYLTIGGQQGYGNEISRVGYLDSFYNADGYIQLDLAQHVNISYNYCHSEEVGWGMAGLYMNNVQSLYLGYNIVKGLQADHHRPPIALKTDIGDVCRQAGPYLIVGNHLSIAYSDDNSWGDGTPLISCSGNYKGFYAFGNYLHDGGTGIHVNIGWSSAKDGCYFGGAAHYLWDDDIMTEDFFIWGNVIANTQGSALSFGGPIGATRDDIINAYSWNNTFYNNVNRDATLGYGSSSLTWATTAGVDQSLKGQYQLYNHHLANNLYYNVRCMSGETSFYQSEIRNEITSLSNDYNVYYNTQSSTLICRERDDDEVVTNYAWNSGSRVDGENDALGNPNLNSPGTGNFHPTSSSALLIGQGRDMGSGLITTLTIAGVNYPLYWDQIPGPGATWHATDPDQIDLDIVYQDQIGWVIGGLGYTSGGVDSTDPVATITSPSAPHTVYTSAANVTFTCTDANGIDWAKWRIGSAPDASNGTLVSGTSPYSATVTGLSSGANSVYVGCADPTGNIGSDSETITYSAAGGSGGLRTDINGVLSALANFDCTRNGINYTSPATSTSVTPSPSSWDPADGDHEDTTAEQTITLTFEGTVVVSSIALTGGANFTNAGTGTCTTTTYTDEQTCTIDLEFEYDYFTCTTCSDSLVITSDADDSPESISLGSTTIATGCTESNCPLGTYVFRWDNNYPSDDDKACLNSCGSSVDGTVGGTISFEDGYAKFDGENESVTWATTFDENSFSIFWTMNIRNSDSFWNAVQAWQSYIGADARMHAYIDYNSGNEVFRVLYRGDTGGVTENSVFIDADDGLTANQDYRCGYSNNGTSHSLSCEPGDDSLDSWSETLSDTDTETLRAWSSAPDDIRAGDGTNITFGEDGIWIKDVIIVSGYQAADPL